MKHFLLLLITVISLSLKAQNWINYTDDRTVNCMLKDADTMWIGTDGGLIRYTISTANRREYNKANSNIPHNKVYDIKKNSAGQLFIGSGRGLAIFSGNQFTFVNGPLGVNSPYTASSIFFDNANNMWVGSAGFVYKYSASSWTTFAAPGMIEDFIQDSNNDMFLAEYGGMYKLVGTTWQLCSSNFQSSFAHEFAKRPNGNIIVGGGSGVFEYNGSSWIRISTLQANSIVVNNKNIPCLATNTGLVMLYKNSALTYSTSIEFQKITRDPITDELWLASTNMVYKTNGTGFYTYLTPTYTFLSNRADVFCVDQKTNMKWMGYCTAGNPYGISKMDNSDIITNITTGNSNLPAGMNFLGMITDTAGTLFVATNYGLMIYNGSTFSVLSSTNSPLPTNFVYDMCLQRNTNTIFMAHGSGMSAYHAGVITNTTAASIGFPGTTVYNVTVDKNDKLWAGAMDKVAKYSGSSWQIFNYQNTALPNSYVKSLSTDSAANLWIGWGSAGISKLAGTTVTNYSMSNSTLKKDDVQQVRCNKSGNVWIAYSTSPTALGASLLSNGVFSHYTTSNGLNNNYVNRIDMDNFGQVWIATRIGLTTYDPQYWAGYSGTSDTQLNYNYVKDIEIDANNDVLIGTRSGISSMSAAGTWSFTGTGGSGLDIYSLTKDKTGKLYAGILGALLEYNTTTPTFYNAINPAKDIAVDSANNKWVPGNYSVYKYKNGSYTAYNMSNSSFRGYLPQSSAVDKMTNEVWVGTQDSGVNVFNGATWINYNSYNYGVPYSWARNFISGIAFDKLGNTWLATHHGLLKYNGSGFTHFDELNSSIPTDYIHALDVDTNNNVWCAHNGGVFMFDGVNSTVYDSTNSPLIPVAYNSIKVNKDNVVFTGGLNDLTTGGGSGLYAFHPAGIGIPTSVKQPVATSGNGFDAFPNPANAELKVMLRGKESAMTIELFNLIGEMVFFKKVNSNTESIDLSSYRSGLYILTVHADSGSWSEKIIKE